MKQTDYVTLVTVLTGPTIEETVIELAYPEHEATRFLVSIIARMAPHYSVLQPDDSTVVYERDDGVRCTHYIRYPTYGD